MTEAADADDGWNPATYTWDTPPASRYWSSPMRGYCSPGNGGGYFKAGGFSDEAMSCTAFQEPPTFL